ncbi:MAG: thiamine pyrophosphate-dependent enzyme [Candidatus Gracilibacteria bacterium]|jgi:2-oxoglutarate ferredoxin oxidoreductase subunit beta
MASIKKASFDSVAKPDWCPGCGLFGIQMAIKQALTELNLEPHKVFFVTGIGCGSKASHWVNAYGMHTLHGRSLPIATGAKLGNHSLTVIDMGGDGDGYGIGIGHFMHTMRRNIDLLYMVNDNQIYGLTKGQASPTSEKGMKTKSTPFGVVETPINPIALAINSGATFIARGFAGDIVHLKWLIMEGIKHKGFSLIDIFQPCVTFNKINTYAYFQQRVYKLNDDPNYKTNDREAAWKKAQETGDKLPIGIFYQESREIEEEAEPQLLKQPLVYQDISKVDIEPLMKKFI